MNYRNTGRLLATLLLGSLFSLQGAILTLGSYLDPNPAPGQSNVNGYVSGTISGDPTYNGSYLFNCADYDFHTASGAVLTGSIGAPMSLDQIVQAVIFYSYAGFMSDPTNNAVDTMAYR